LSKEPKKKKEKKSINVQAAGDSGKRKEGKTLNSRIPGERVKIQSRRRLVKEDKGLGGAPNLGRHYGLGRAEGGQQKGKRRSCDSLVGRNPRKKLVGVVKKEK